MGENRELEITVSNISSNLSQVKQNSKEHPYVSACVHLRESIFGQILIRAIGEVLEILSHSLILQMRIKIQRGKVTCQNSYN